MCLQDAKAANQPHINLKGMMIGNGELSFIQDVSWLTSLARTRCCPISFTSYFLSSCENVINNKRRLVSWLIMSPFSSAVHPRSLTTTEWSARRE